MQLFQKFPGKWTELELKVWKKGALNIDVVNRIFGVEELEKRGMPVDKKTGIEDAVRCCVLEDAT